VELDLRQYKLIVESSPNMIWRAGTDGKCDYFNQTWLKFTNRTLEQEFGNGWAEGVHAEDLERCLQIYTDAFAKRESFEMEYRLRRFDGEYRWINDRGVPAYDAEGTFVGYIGSCMDVTEKIEGVMLREQAQMDGLCQIFNRHYFDQLLQNAWRFAQQQGHELAVIMMDIDDFKQVNDRYGHPAGDQVLHRIAETIKASIRDRDICGRYGGEEFIVAAPHADAAEAIGIAERIRSEIAALRICLDVAGGAVISVTVSCGIGYLKAGDDTVLEIIQRADQGLYFAKHAGKNCVKVMEKID
jgi:diguanylate cyclase (GGDEF)-like protein/PAS domain S-box-containing protein